MFHKIIVYHTLKNLVQCRLQVSKDLIKYVNFIDYRRHDIASTQISL